MDSGFFKDVFQPFRPKFEMIPLALHEAEPGHHLQVSWWLLCYLNHKRQKIKDEGGEWRVRGEGEGEGDREEGRGRGEWDGEGEMRGRGRGNGEGKRGERGDKRQQTILSCKLEPYWESIWLSRRVLLQSWSLLARSTDCLCYGAGESASLQEGSRRPKILWGSGSVCLAHGLHGGEAGFIRWFCLRSRHIPVGCFVSLFSISLKGTVKK